jgi:hypothetical protein
MWTYYMYVNITALNRLRQDKGLSQCRLAARPARWARS